MYNVRIGLRIGMAHYSVCKYWLHIGMAIIRYVKTGLHNGTLSRMKGLVYI